MEAAEKFLKVIYYSSLAWAIWSKLHFCNSFCDCALIDLSFSLKRCRHFSMQVFKIYILYFVSRLSIEEQSDVIMEEYHTGWAARAAQELDEQILSSGIEPVRLK